MIAIALTTVSWLLRHVLTFLLIIFVLLVGRAGWAEWESLQSVRAESARLADADRHLAAQLDRLTKDAIGRANGLRSASLQALQARVAAVDGEITQKRREKQQFGGLGKVLTGTPIVQAQLEGMRLDAEIYVLNQERSYLLELISRLRSTQSEQSNRAELERMRLIHVSLYQQWKEISRQRDALEQTDPLKCRFGYGTPEYKKCEAIQTQQALLVTKNSQADADYRNQLRLLQNPRLLVPLGAFELRRSEVDAITQPLRSWIAELDRQREANWVGKVLGPVEEVAPTALLVLLGVVITPIAIKALFYFVLAPLAACRPPLLLLPETTGELTLETGHSSVSKKVVVDPDHELLVHAEFLQSSSVRGEKDTRWLLNWEMPLTSLASGMVALTRIRTVAPETFVISATQDPFSEIGILSLAQGAALVMQPHNLVGVVQPWGSPVRITSHWRLNSLHAWLTLQLRYLTFHGPAQLIVQGCRGVRIERADAGRSINQAATIGFSANLAYSTRRCETFGAYLLGKQELLNDTFSGENGFYVYEEMPHFGKKTGVTGRGLEGLTDSLLKVLGI